MSTTMAKQYTRILALWPKDALRPDFPFTRVIEHRALPFGVQPVAPAPPDTQAKPSAPRQTSSSPQLEQAQVNALFSLLENRYSNKYALSPAVFKPASAPDHYTNLMDEIERAPKKSWWQAKMDEWKMKIRWS